ncbi:MAG: hypothetical protein R2731_19025 [Nocardioides sp.]
MLVLVATRKTNGALPDDFDHCVEGELVTIDEPCDDDLRDPDGGGCGCGRSFSGLHSHRATTTAAVVERDLSEADVREAIRSSLVDGGWIYPDRTTRELAEELVESAWVRVHAVTEHFPAGTVVGRRLERIFPRLGGPAG